jgi:hypothetical protein
MRRTKSVFIFLLAFLTICTAAVEAGNGWGIGFMVGNPTGLSFKAWSGKTKAFDIGAAWSFGDENKLQLHADFLLHHFRIFNVESGQLPFYIGIGGRIKFEAETRLGIRVPVGLCYLFKNHPIDIFFEVVPVIDLAPETELNLNASLGIRYFFK